MKNLKLTTREMNFVRGGDGAPSDSTSTKKVEPVQAPKDTTTTYPPPPPESPGGYTVTTKNNPPSK